MQQAGLGRADRDLRHLRHVVRAGVVRRLPRLRALDQSQAPAAGQRHEPRRLLDRQLPLGHGACVRAQWRIQRVSRHPPFCLGALF